jgi:hypothetical protein
MLPHVGIVERRRRRERKSKRISSARYWFFFLDAATGAPYSNSKLFFRLSFVFFYFRCFFFLLSVLKNWFYLNLFSFVLKLIQFHSAKTELLIVRSENDKGILLASENKYLPLFFLLMGNVYRKRTRSIWNRVASFRSMSMASSYIGNRNLGLELNYNYNFLQFCSKRKKLWLNKMTWSFIF